VIDRKCHLQAQQEFSLLQQILRGEMELYMPAQWRDSLCEAKNGVGVRRRLQVLDEVEAHAAHAGGVELSKFCVRDVRANQRDAATARRVARDGVEHRTVVVAMDRRLHVDGPVDAQQAMQRLQPPDGGIIRRVRPLRCIGKTICRSIDVDVAVAAACRQSDSWFAHMFEGWRHLVNVAAGCPVHGAHSGLIPARRTASRDRA
jgi:hypothetical protein